MHGTAWLLVGAGLQGAFIIKHTLLSDTSFYLLSLLLLAAQYLLFQTGQQTFRAV
jgi:hypothetical protein